MKIFNLTIFIFLFSSCLKTAGQIQRENQGVIQKEQSQKMLADLIVKTKNLEDQVSTIQGNFQEISHKGKTDQAFKKDDLDELRVTVEEQNRKIISLEKELKEQKKFVKSVTKTLSKLSKVLLK